MDIFGQQLHTAYEGAKRVYHDAVAAWHAAPNVATLLDMWGARNDYSFHAERWTTYRERIYGTQTT